MEENKRSKNYEEIFEEKYPIKSLEESPMVCAEAFGYLECLESFMPTSKWISAHQAVICEILLKHAIKMAH